MSDETEHNLLSEIVAKAKIAVSEPTLIDYLSSYDIVMEKKRDISVE